MSDTESRKSMDDVLASIRKIVRAEKDPEGVQDAEVSAPEAAPMSTAQEAVEESAPLTLTPDMMMDTEIAQDAAGQMDEVAQAVETVKESAGEMAAIDPDMIREMVREVVMEQLSGSDADGMIRNIIRHELVTGDVGSNISKNVLRLIRTEISSALDK